MKNAKLTFEEELKGNVKMKRSKYSRILLSTGFNKLLVTTLLGIILAGFWAHSSQAAPISIGGGTTTLGLDAGSPKPIFTFINGTNMIFHDLLLSTNDSDGFDPDFEGPVTVRTSPGGTSLAWTQSSQGDGVEDVKIVSPGDAGDIALGGEFTVEMEFDGVDVGDILKVTPTNKTGHQIQNSVAQGTSNTYNLFNGYDGLDGSLDMAYASINGLNLSISSIVFSSPTSGIFVTSVESSQPSYFDITTGILEFSTPISPGNQVDYLVSVNDLGLFSSNDPDPFTKIIASAITVSEPDIWLLVVIGLVCLLGSRRGAFIKPCG